MRSAIFQYAAAHPAVRARFMAAMNPSHSEPRALNQSPRAPFSAPNFGTTGAPLYKTCTLSPTGTFTDRALCDSQSTCLAPVSYGCDGMGNVTTYPEGVGACGTNKDACNCWTCGVDPVTNKAACVAAPANVDQTTPGLYATQGACSADPNKKCGWTYGCASITDTTSPDYGYQCTLMQNGGKWGVQGDCQCISPLTATGAAQTAVTFNSTVGPDCKCGYDPAFTGTPLFKTLDACKADTRGFMCGWGYSCNTATAQTVRGITESSATPPLVNGAPNLQYALSAGGAPLYSPNLAYAIYITVDGVITIRGNDGSIRFQSNIYNDATGATSVPVRTTVVPALQTAYIRMVGGNLVFTNFLGVDYLNTALGADAATTNFFTLDNDGVGRVYKQAGTPTAPGTLPSTASFITSTTVTPVWSTDSVLLPGMRLYAWNSTLDASSTKLLDSANARGFGSLLGSRLQVDTATSRMVLVANSTNAVSKQWAMASGVVPGAGIAWLVLTPTGTVRLYSATSATATASSVTLVNNSGNTTIDPTFRVQLGTDGTLKLFRGATVVVTL